MTAEEMERAIEFLLANQAKHDAQIAEIREQVAETNLVIRMQGESQTQFNEMVTQAITSLAEAQRRTETKVERLADKVERLADKVDRLADIVERGNARQNETDARLDRLSEVVERLATRGE
jgi:peptidoglycan hydrolase CwlO-like protein